MNRPPLILTADDDKEFLDIIDTKLTAKGFVVKTACDGNDAIKKAKELHPDVIVMDVQMPGKDGIDATIDITSDPHTRDIKVIFLTNLGDPSAAEINRRMSQQIGAIGYFKKGGELEGLIEKIREVLAQ